jgi:thioredoxin 1
LNLKIYKTMPEVHITKLEQFQELTKSNVAVVKFTASWCGPCRRMAPDFEALAKIDYEPKASFMSIDLDEAEGNSELRGLIKDVSSIPTFHFYKDGKVVDKLTGANVAALKEKLDKLTQEASMVCCLAPPLKVELAPIEQEDVLELCTGHIAEDMDPEVIAKLKQLEAEGPKSVEAISEQAEEKVAEKAEEEVDDKAKEEVDYKAKEEVDEKAKEEVDVKAEDKEDEEVKPDEKKE